MSNINMLYDLWCENAKNDPDLISELETIKGNENEINDRFYRSLEFGTGGLRGVIGAGTNRMNVYTVNQATQGLADYLKENFEKPSVAIAHDSRNKSDLFAKSAACVLAANGIKVYLYKELVPTPMLSFAVRRLECSSGIVITASHNPAKYNGFKCYDPRGFQMTDEGAKATYEYIQKVDIFNDVKVMDFDTAIENKRIEYIEDWLIKEFFDNVEEQRIDKDACTDSDLKIIYTPLNGTGNKPVRRILKRLGLTNVRIVPEQENPDGNFPTCPYPNPEIRQAFECALKMAEEESADLLLATDPDCDRVGIAVNTGDDYRLMTGNEVGAMLTEYILSTKKKEGTLPKNPIVVKTIVTSELIRSIADKYNTETADLLTGFKYIGELITQLEEKGEAERYILGMEESYGYLAGTYARDKDGVVAAMLIAEMAAHYKKLGKTLADVMDEIYAEHGIYLNTLLNFAFEGAEGMATMSNMMENLRQNPPASIANLDVVKISDYKTSVATETASGIMTHIDLPKSNVLSYSLVDGCSAIVRPSGTEPKIKIYITAHANSFEDADRITSEITEDMKKILGIK
ncbi:MAG: phospho-sugar mutase [Ruminococcaceae bacterium]|nr:phospho-sugar mutase [Oscillospiraceae bacterium]